MTEEESEGWDAFAQELSGTSTGSAILTDDGTICGKYGYFNATEKECQSWANIYKDLSSARQKPLSVAGKKLFVYDVDDSLITARCDNYFLFFQKSKTIIVCAIVEEMYGPSRISPEDVKDSIQGIVDELAESGF